MFIFMFIFMFICMFVSACRLSSPIFKESCILVFRWCGNINRPHKSNGVYFVVDLAEGSWSQRCYDPSCRGYRSPPMPLPHGVWDLCRTWLEPPKLHPAPSAVHEGTGSISSTAQVNMGSLLGLDPTLGVGVSALSVGQVQSDEEDEALLRFLEGAGL